MPPSVPLTCSSLSSDLLSLFSVSRNEKKKKKAVSVIMLHKI